MSAEPSNLRLFIDSVDEKDWMAYLPTGLFYGVTTNPKLLAEAGFEFKTSQLAKLAVTAFDLGAQEIHLQVWGREAEQMLAIGRELGSIDSRVMVKVLLTRPGLSCARQLLTEGLNVTLTAIHGAEQVLSAVALGVNYAAPYLGRMNDGGLDGIEEVLAMNRMVVQLKSSTRLLVASIRRTSDLVTLAGQGLNTFTLLPSLIDQLLENDLTQMAAESFQAAVEGKKG